MTPEHTIFALWVAWLVSWTVAAQWSNRTEKRSGFATEVVFRILAGIGAILLFALPAIRPATAHPRLWHLPDSAGWILVVLTLGGLLFAWWARIHLGRLWSDWCVTKKTGHHVVDSGPYRLVRHPIYFGLIAAALATALEEGTLSALAGTGAIALAFYIKACREERFLRAELEAGAYEEYARNTAMLLPRVRIHN